MNHDTATNLAKALTGGSVTDISTSALLQRAHIAALTFALHALAVLLTQLLVADPTGGLTHVFGRVITVKPGQVGFALAFASLAQRSLLATQPR